MKLFRLAVAAVFAFAFGNAYAFHSGGVAECEGCHTMHNSFENSAMEVEATGAFIGTGIGLAQFQSGPYLLKGSDQSSACLNCHNAQDTTPGTAAKGNSYHISTDAARLDKTVVPVEYTPGGDFSWLKKTYTITIRGNTSLNDGDRHGHNIIALDYGYLQDGKQTGAPGPGTGLTSYPAANLHCSSCHDPHGKYRVMDGAGTVATTGLPIYTSGSYGATAKSFAATGVYRILGGVGYQPKSVTGSVAFANPPPIAVSPSNYNYPDSADGATQLIVAYGKGMGEWCGNCHAKMVENAYVSGVAKHVHPAGNSATLKADQVTNYTTYISSGKAGAGMGKYSNLAPFEFQEANAANLKAKLASTDPAALLPTTSSTVMCLSCHRAHASGFQSMTRYFLDNEFMTTATATGTAIYDSNTTENKMNWGYDTATQQAAYYGRDASAFGPYARNYCNKCHAKD